MDATCAPVPTSVLFSGNARQGIEVRGGTMAADTLWKNWNANAPYAATGGVSVAAGVRFTIEPGTTVKWNGSTGTALRVHGVLIADGAAAPITFTGLHDDSVGGDTNGDGASAPGRGEWLGVYLSPASGASVLNQCAIRYAGADNYGNGMGVYNSAGRKCLVYVDRCSPTITRCAFAESERHGLELYGSEAAIQENTFTNMGSGHYAIVYDTPNTLPVISGNSASGTGIAGICLSGGSITRTGRWMKPGASFPYYLYTNHSFAGGTTFTIDPGTTIRFSGSTSAALYVQGTLSAAGTAAEPITFTSAQDSPGPGNWLGIYLGPQAGASVLSYCTLAYAGADNYGNGMGVYNSAGRKCALYVDACSPRVTDCTIESPERHGIELYNSAATLRNNTFRNVRSDMFALVFDTPNTFPVVSGTVFAGSPGRIHLAGGTISKSGRWMKAGGNFAYYLGAAQHINAGVTLTVDPGVTVRLSGSGSTGIYVAGTLKAVGGALAPITFTSSAASPGRGNWLGIYLGPTAGRSALCYCTIACAGADNYGNGLGSYHSAGRRCTLFVDGCTPTLSNLTISDSERNGLEIYGGSPTLYSSLFLSCGWSGIVAEAGAAPLIANNTVSGCGGGISCSGASPRIVNNIVAFNGSGITRSGGEPTLGSNCVYGNPSGDYAGIAAGAGDFSMDPLFVDRAAGDYHTPGQSPGINAGNNSAVQSTWRDHDGRARVYGGRVDLGAYELPRLPAPAKPDLLIRNAGDTGWVGGNAFGTSQSRAQMASAAMKAIYEVKVENDGEAAGPFVLKAVESAGTGWAITYKAGDTDISDQMRGGGYPVPLMAGASAVVTVDVQPGAMVTPGAVKTFLFRVYKDAADTTSRDLVSAKTTAAPAKKLAFLMQPSNVGAGTAIAPAVQVAVQDQFGGTVPVAKTVTLAIATNPAGGRLTGTLSASTVHGVATFSNLKIDRAGSGYTLRATASGLAAATSAAFDVSAGAKAKMVFTVQPASTLAGSVMSPAVVVSIVDAAGNLVADATDTVILTIARNPARGTLSGSTAVAAVGGVAAFAGLSIDKAGVGYMLRASAADLTGVYSATFDITSGPVAARRGDRGVLVAACAGEQAVGYLAPSRLDSPESGGRSAGLRFVPLQAPAGRSPGSAWEFAIEASWPSADVTITWPDLSGMGSGDRVVLQDLDATVRRSMRSTASYTFRAGQGVQRRFRVLAEPRGAGGVAITGLEVAPLRSNTRVVRFTLSTDASVDLEILSPSGRTVATVARGRAFMQGVNQAVWSGPAAPGLYLLRAAATAEDGGVVQAVRPVAVVR